MAAGIDEGVQLAVAVVGDEDGCRPIYMVK
jgi:hypothetical protein